MPGKDVTGTAKASPPRRGRPPKISRGDIASAALDIGLEQATIRNVADKLGVSVMGIYHHVRNADDLRDLVLARELHKLLPPADYASFEEMLWACARNYYDLLVSYPEMMLRLVGGKIDPGGTALYFEALLTCGGEQGFGEAETFMAARNVLNSAAGAALNSAAETRGTSAPFLTVLAQGAAGLKDDAKPHVTRLLEGAGEQVPDPLECVRLTILGLRQVLGERMSRDNRKPGPSPQ